MSLLDEMHSEDFVCHDQNQKESVEKHLDQAKKCIQKICRAFPDLRGTADDVIAEEKKIAIRWTARGTHKGELLGFAPTDGEIILKGITILIIEKKKIRDAWVLPDYRNLWSRLRNEQA